MKKSLLTFILIVSANFIFAQLSPAESEKIIMENEKNNVYRYKNLSHQYIISFSDTKEKLSLNQLNDLKEKYAPEIYDLSISYDKKELVFKAPCETDYAIIKRFISIATPTYNNIQKTGYYKK